MLAFLGITTTLEARLALGAVVLAAICGYVLYHDHVEIAKGRAEELALFKASSDKLLAEANAKIKAQTEQHAADVAANQVKLNAQLKANAVLSASLDNRVRAFSAYIASHPDVPRPSGGSSPAGPGECGTLSCGDLAVRLAERGDDLARSNGELAAALQSAQRDRDALTGLPR